MSDTPLDVHWEAVYRTKVPDKVSWYRPHLEVSLDLLVKAGLGTDSRVIDVGAGASSLVDDLVARGVRSVIALDVSDSALRIARDRMGPAASRVQWIIGDITTVSLPKSSVDLWHDRAAFHFLTSDAAVRAYVDAATRTIAQGGFAIIGGFASDGPTQCSGLPVMRRDAADMAELFRSHFKLIDSRTETHVTPSGAAQRFVYVSLQKH